MALHVLPLANPTLHLLAPGFTGPLHPVSLQSPHSPSSPAVPGLARWLPALFWAFPSTGPLELHDWGSGGATHPHFPARLRTWA